MSLRRYTRQVIAITEKNIFLDLRNKPNLFLRFFNPIIQLITLIFIFGILFQIKEGYHIGYWNADNFVLFLLIAFAIQFPRTIIGRFNDILVTEKYWKTLSAIMVAPVHRFTLLVGILCSEFIIVSIPFLILVIIAYILFPISIFYLFLFLIVYFLIYFTFGAIGLIISAFGISHEEYVPVFNIVLRFAFLFSCATFPKEIFPEIIQTFVVINPFYYFVDLLRLIWYLGVDYETAISNITPFHLIIIITLPIVLPIFALILFERVYRKYGITGY